MRLSHAPTIARSKDARLVGVFDGDAERAEELAANSARRPIPHWRRCLRPRTSTPSSWRRPTAIIREGGDRGRGRRQARALREAARDRHQPRAADGRRLRRAPASSCRSASTSASGRRCRSPRRCVDSGFIGKVHGFRSIYSEKSTAYPGDDALPLRPRAIRRRHDHRPHHPPHRSRAASGRRFFRASSPNSPTARSPTRSTTMSGCSRASRTARAARCRATATRRRSATAPTSTAPKARSTSRRETLNPFHAAPLAVYTEKRREGPARRAARGALSGRLVEERSRAAGSR